METLGDKLVAKSGIFIAKNFYCEKCHYKCSKKYNWDKHLLTSKHNKVTFGDNLVVVNSATIPSGKLQKRKKYSELSSCKGSTSS